MSQLFTNNAASTLNVTLGVGVLTLSIPVADAAKFPSPSGGDFFIGTLVKNTGEFEIIRIDENVGDGTFTIVRAQEGTSELAFSIGDVFSLRVTSGTLSNFAQKDGSLQANLNAHKVNGFEASSNAQAGKLLALNGAGKLPASITGNCDGNANSASNAALLEGADLTDVLNRNNHTGGAGTVNSTLLQNMTAGDIKVTQKIGNFPAQAVHPAYDKIIECRALNSGVVRVGWIDGAVTMYTKVYKNDVEESPEFYGGGTRSFDLAVAAGDLIQIYGNLSSDGHSGDDVINPYISIGSGIPLFSEWIEA